MKLITKRKIKLQDITVNVHIVDVAEYMKNGEKQEVFGFFESPNNLYVSTRDYRGRVLSLKYVMGIICHELTHAIFLDGQYIREHNDEPLVEWMGKNIRCLIDERKLNLTEADIRQKPIKEIKIS